MPVLELLKKLLSMVKDNSPSLLTLNINNIRIVHNESPPVSAHDESSVTINVNALEPESRALAENIVRLSISDCGKILSDTFEKQTEDFRESTDNEDYQRLFRDLEGIIPPDDVPLLKACLYLLIRHRAGKPVSDIKAQIVRSYGQRGRNLANLCSAKYMEEWIMPAFEGFKQQYPNRVEAVDKFRVFWREIVAELPWTIFVNFNDTSQSLAGEIIGKLDQNIQYGIGWVNVHGIGEHNVNTINEAIQTTNCKRPDITISMEKSKSSVFVRFGIDPSGVNS